MKPARIVTECRQGGGGLGRLANVLDETCIRPILDELKAGPLSADALEEISNINDLIGDSNRVLGEGVKSIGIMVHHLACSPSGNDGLFRHFGPDLGVILEEMGNLIIGLKSSQELVNMAVERQLTQEGGAQ